MRLPVTCWWNPSPLCCCSWCEMMSYCPACLQASHTPLSKQKKTAGIWTSAPLGSLRRVRSNPPSKAHQGTRLGNMLTFNHRQREGGHVAVTFPLQNVMHEGTVVAVGQWDLSVVELMLEAVVEEVEQELTGQTGSTGKLLLRLHRFKKQKRNSSTLQLFIGYCSQEP